MPVKAKSSTKTVKPKATRSRKQVVQPIIEQPVNYNSAPVIREYQPRSSWGTTIISIIIILMVAGSLGAAWVWRTSLMNGAADDSQSDNYQIPLGITLNQPSDPLAGWGTYQSAAPEFTLRYPGDWQIDTAATSTDSSTTVTRLVSNKSQDVSFEIIATDHEGTIAEYLKDLDKLTAKAFEGKPSVEVFNEQPVSISSWPAIIRSQKLLAADLNQVIAYIKIGDNIVSFALTAPVVDESLASIYNQVLSTLATPTANIPATATTTSATTTATSTIEQ